MAHLPEGIAWQTVSYPIKLVREAPAWPIGVLVLSWLTSFAIEAAFLALGWSTNVERADLAGLAFDALRSMPSSFLGAMLMTFILVRFGDRERTRRFGANDVRLVVGVAVVLGVITSPLLIALVWNERANLPSNWSNPIGLALAAVSAYVGLRFSFALPLSLATGRLQVLASWRETRDLVWNLLGISALVIATLAVPMFFLMLAVGLPMRPEPERAPFLAAATLTDLLNAGAMNAIRAISLTYIITAQTYLFHRLWPREKWEGRIGAPVAST